MQAYLIEGIFTPMFLNLALTSSDNLTSSSVIRSMLVLSYINWKERLVNHRHTVD